MAMGIMSLAVREPPEVRASVQGPQPLTSASIVELLSGPPSASGRRINGEGALRNSAVYACVRVLAEGVASLPRLLYRRLDDRAKERAVDHPLFPILHRRPNPWMSAFQLAETQMGHLQLWGNSFCEIMRDDAGRITGLFPLRPDRMERPTISDAGTLLYRYALPSGQTTVLRQSSVLHLRGLSSDGLWGYSPVALAREAIGIGLTAEEFAGRFFNNAAQPGGVLQVKGNLSPDAARKLAANWTSAHSGLQNSHRVAVLEEGVEWKQVGMPMHDAQFLETRNYQLQEVARIFRVPLHLIGDLSRSTNNNIEHQSLEFVIYSLMPWLERIEQEIDNTLLIDAEQRAYFVEHLVDGLLRGDVTARQAFYTAMTDRGILSINDIRALENMNPVPSGDKRFVQANMQLLDQAGEDQSDPDAVDEQEAMRITLNIGRYEDLGETEIANLQRRKLRELYGIDPDTEPTPPEPKPVPAQQAALPAPESRSMRARLRLRGQYLPLLQDAIERVVTREVAAIRANAPKLLRRRTNADFLAWLDEYEVNDLRPILERTVAPILTSYASAVEAEAFDELGIPGVTELQDQTLQAYIVALAATYSGRSLGQMRQMIERAGQQQVSALSLIEERLLEWLEKRSSRVAGIEAVRAGEAFAVDAYRRGGVRRLKWRKQGSRTCPYCNSLNGKTVGILEQFLPAGEDYQPDGAERPLKPRWPVRHAPAHGSCDCLVIPER